MKMEQREVDNMLLSMIQKHFPSLPLSDEHTDWGKWLGFARAVYEAGRASPASVLGGWKHSCNALCMGDVELWIPQCPHCGKPAPTPPVSEDRKDAELYGELLYAVANKFPGESRHQTALRYIRNAEKGSDNATMQENKP